MGLSSGVQQSGLATGFDRILRSLGGYEISVLCFTKPEGAAGAALAANVREFGNRILKPRTSSPEC